MVYIRCMEEVIEGGYLGQDPRSTKNHSIIST